MMRIFASHIALKMTVEREGVLGGTPAHEAVFSTYLRGGLPVLTHETSHDYDSFQLWEGARKHDKTTFFGSKRERSSECLALLKQTQRLQTETTATIECAAGIYETVRPGGEPDWYFIYGEAGGTWLRGHVPVISVTPQGEHFATWEDELAKAGEGLGLFGLRRQAA